MSTTKTTATKSPNPSEQEHHERWEESYSVVRIIAGIIHWWSKSDTWVNDPMRCRRWKDREAAYACAQSMRGLLVVGCGLADLEREDPRMALVREVTTGSIDARRMGA